jgi:four helix bundle protein
VQFEPIQIQKEQEKQMLKNFRTYQMAMQLYRDCQKLKLEEPVKDQLHRAMLSVPLNLSEGSAKPTAKDRNKFYFVALGSLREVQTILELLDESHLMKQADQLAASLYKLCKS